MEIASFDYSFLEPYYGIQQMADFSNSLLYTPELTDLRYAFDARHFYRSRIFVTELREEYYRFAKSILEATLESVLTIVRGSRLTKFEGEYPEMYQYIDTLDIELAELADEMVVDSFISSNVSLANSFADEARSEREIARWLKERFFSDLEEMEVESPHLYQEYFDSYSDFIQSSAISSLELLFKGFNFITLKFIRIYMEEDVEDLHALETKILFYLTMTFTVGELVSFYYTCNNVEEDIHHFLYSVQEEYSNFIVEYPGGLGLLYVAALECRKIRTSLSGASIQLYKDMKLKERYLPDIKESNYTIDMLGGLYDKTIREDVYTTARDILNTADNTHKEMMKAFVPFDISHKELMFLLATNLLNEILTKNEYVDNIDIIESRHLIQQLGERLSDGLLRDANAAKRVREVLIEENTDSAFYIIGSVCRKRYVSALHFLPKRRRSDVLFGGDPVDTISSLENIEGVAVLIDYAWSILYTPRY